MPETDTHREDIFLRKLMNKANIGWWEADVKTECYKCSGFIAQLLGLDEDGIISFNDFNKRILREDQQHTTSHSFDELQQTIEEVYLLDTPKGGCMDTQQDMLPGNRRGRKHQDIWHSRNTRRTTYGVRLPGIAKQ